MPQHDFDIANQTTPAFRADLNSALGALVSLSSGSTSPATTYANMLWYDTSANTLKMRSEADDAWIDIGVLNQSTNQFEPAGVAELTQVQVEDDTSTVFGQVSGQRLSQAVAAFETASVEGFGVNQTWQDVASSRAIDVSYQAPSDKAIQVDASWRTDTFGPDTVSFQVSSNGSTWITIRSAVSTKDGEDTVVGYGGVIFTIPAGNYYRLDSTGGGVIERWIEMR